MFSRLILELVLSELDVSKQKSQADLNNRRILGLCENSC